MARIDENGKIRYSPEDSADIAYTIIQTPTENGLEVTIIEDGVERPYKAIGNTEKGKA